MERRKFIQNVAITGTSLLIGPNLAMGGIFKGSPNKKVVIGIMGVNSRGAFLAQKLAALPDVEIGYICDVDSVMRMATVYCRC
jgi:hypothetical protein